MDCPMRGVRAVTSCLFAALALSGCIRTTTPVAQTQSDLDAMAYGQPYGMAPAPTAAAYAAAPMPVAHDSAYRLGAGDRLRVVIYGQEGLTNTYAIDAGGSITMPLIGAVPARGRTPAGLAAEITGRLRRGYSASRPWPWKSKPTGRFLSSAKLQPPANIPTCPT
jgi:polysaccharide biosynthesis/export protein